VLVPPRRRRVRTMKMTASAAIAPLSKISIPFTGIPLPATQAWHRRKADRWAEGPAQRRAERVNTRMDTAVMTAAKAATTPRLSQAMAVTLLMPQMLRSPAASPRSP